MGGALSGRAKNPPRNFIHRPSGRNSRQTFPITARQKCSCELRAGNPAARNSGRIFKRDPRRGGWKPPARAGLAGVERRLTRAGAAGANVRIAGRTGNQRRDSRRSRRRCFTVRDHFAERGTANLAGFNEKKPGAGVINAGVYLFRASAVDSFPDKTPLSFETEVFPALIAEKIRIESLRDGRAVFGYRNA